MDGQDTKWHRNIVENFDCLRRAQEHYRQTTDRQTDRRRQFTFANKTYLKLKDLESDREAEN